MHRLILMVIPPSVLIAQDCINSSTFFLHIIYREVGLDALINQIWELLGHFFGSFWSLDLRHIRYRT